MDYADDGVRVFDGTDYSVKDAWVAIAALRDAFLAVQLLWNPTKLLVVGLMVNEFSEVVLFDPEFPAMTDPPSLIRALKPGEVFMVLGVTLDHLGCFHMAGVDASFKVRCPPSYR